MMVAPEAHRRVAKVPVCTRRRVRHRHSAGLAPPGGRARTSRTARRHRARLAGSI